MELSGSAFPLSSTDRILLTSMYLPCWAYVWCAQFYTKRTHIGVGTLWLPSLACDYHIPQNLNQRRCQLHPRCSTQACWGFLWPWQVRFRWAQRTKLKMIRQFDTQLLSIGMTRRPRWQVATGYMQARVKHLWGTMSEGPNLLKN